MSILVFDGLYRIKWYAYEGAGHAVIVKTREQLQEVLDGNPFTGAAHDIRRVFFTLGNAPLADPNDLNAQDFGEDKLVIAPQAAYLYIPHDASRSKLGNAFLEKQLGQSLTTRNFNTLNKMLRLTCPIF